MANDSQTPKELTDIKSHPMVIRLDGIPSPDWLEQLIVGLSSVRNMMSSVISIPVISIVGFIFAVVFGIMTLRLGLSARIGFSVIYIIVSLLALYVFLGSVIHFHRMKLKVWHLNTGKYVRPQGAIRAVFLQWLVPITIVVFLIAQIIGGFIAHSLIDSLYPMVVDTFGVITHKAGPGEPGLGVFIYIVYPIAAIVGLMMMFILSLSIAMLQMMVSSLSLTVLGFVLGQFYRMNNMDISIWRLRILGVFVTANLILRYLLYLMLADGEYESAIAYLVVLIIFDIAFYILAVFCLRDVSDLIDKMKELSNLLEKMKKQVV